MYRALVFALIASAPCLALAAGSSTPSLPAPSETTTTCAEGLIWDLATQSCMTPEQSTNDDNAMMENVRELAHFGRYADASAVLDQMAVPTDPRVMTYRGFLARKTGDFDLGLTYYRAAIEADPNNILARSYMGQAFVEEGSLSLAQAELTEIRMRGGRGTWPEVALLAAIQTGIGYSH